MRVVSTSNKHWGKTIDTLTDSSKSDNEKRSKRGVEGSRRHNSEGRGWHTDDVCSEHGEGDFSRSPASVATANATEMHH